jgi:thymidylate synthase
VVRSLLSFGVKESTRNGDAWVAPKPMTIRYRFPKRHVLVNPIRDANPFFHLMEAMWMLAGREDGVFLDHYVKDFSKKFGTEDGIIPDAYGFRWRYGLEYDQLKEIIYLLRRDPTTRQAVLQMWGAISDQPTDVHDLMTTEAKPCNLVATFRIWQDRLDMTVFNRSNDVIWGACGANAVHFPIMQEYIAAMIGVAVGHYWQISTNMHLYTEHQNMLLHRMDTYNIKDKTLFAALRSPLEYETTMPLIDYPESFDDDLSETMMLIDLINRDEIVYEGNIANRFLREVVLPMAHAHRFYKIRNAGQALIEIENIAAEDWRKASKEWIKRRTSIRVGEEEYGQPV